ncbi:NitT/TauT family transport system substrate-binding protein [Arthrobacter sp. V4I6]|uniref:ABC transporter substrate-binding protein n=1 Tax=unclassified Arthrobacter TaxID=235627 RepID=UPI00277F8AD4|nr:MULTISPECIES: ABC transporter substrate-binding protein [unclassified Arthrobacter]MDQ0819828.1 NitT/TauT family transport system substrate-binding protein [Arthrobacter sp. V1I7]MDQ0854007.1 NitT/TauT family transport system substrate-binding protein [Arthrobacter sp. V4I6]
MSSTPEKPTPGPPNPQPTPGTTRIVAGESGKPKRRRTLEISIAAGLAVLIGAGAAVASTVSRPNADAAAPAAVAASPATELRLGYFGNITHAPALVGVSQGLIAKNLGDTKLSTQVFNAGPAAIEALNAGAIDATYIGPNPAINSYVKSKGESIRIIAGAASGGAQLVVKPEITSAADLKGRKLATPQLGGTQDVALRAWLGKQGYKTSTDGSGDVAINPTENAQTLKLFQDGKLDGAWLPEPWASRLVLQAGATVLVDEKDLWDKGEFITTVLIVNKNFAAEHPDTVKALLKGHAESVDWLTAAPAADKATTLNAALKESAGAALPPEVIDRSLKNIGFTVDPLAGTYRKLLQDGVDAGTTSQADINGIFDLTALNSVVSEGSSGNRISAQGLGKD